MRDLSVSFVIAVRAMQLKGSQNEHDYVVFRWLITNIPG
jgi:hypothetical protein